MDSGFKLDSLWQFSNKLIKKIRGSGHDIHLEQVFDMFSSGSYWDNLLGYGKANLESPNNVLFLRYEAMLEDDLGHVRKLAQFLGYSFTREEEKNIIAQEIVKLCSFNNIRYLSR
ncbi:hypothetical protein ACFE04_027065 [Oxalis oulophora]